MADVPEHFGIRKSDGSIERDVTVSALSGRTILPGDVTIRVGSRYFYRLTALEYKQLTPEQRAELEAPVRPARSHAVKADEKKD